MQKYVHWLSVALLLVGLSACTQTDDRAAQEAAAREFLTERNDGTPVALGDDRSGPLAIGTIERIDGRKLTLKRPIDGSSTTIELRADAQLYQQTAAERQSIAVGETLLALGAQSGDTFAAQAIQLGTSALDGGGIVQMRPGVAPAGASTGAQSVPLQPGGEQGDTTIGAAQGAVGEPRQGTVTRIDGDTIELSAADGTRTTITLSDATQITRQTEVALDALTPGALVLAQGSRSGDVLLAERVELLPSPQR